MKKYLITTLLTGIVLFAADTKAEFKKAEQQMFEKVGSKEIVPKSGTWVTKANHIRPVNCPSVMVNNFTAKSETLKLRFGNIFHPKALFEKDGITGWKQLGPNLWQATQKTPFAKMQYKVGVISDKRIALKSKTDLFIPDFQSGKSKECKIEALGYFDYVGDK